MLKIGAKMIDLSWVHFVTSVVGLLFLTSALAKIRSFKAFQAAVSAYELLPKGSIWGFSVFVTAAEILIGGAMTFGFGRQIAALSAIALLFLFSSAMTIKLTFGIRDLKCGCMLFRGQTITWGTLLRNFALSSYLGIEIVPEKAFWCFGLGAIVTVVHFTASSSKWSRISDEVLSNPPDCNSCKGDPRFGLQSR